MCSRLVDTTVCTTTACLCHAVQDYYCLTLKLTIVSNSGRMAGMISVPPFDLHTITQARQEWLGPVQQAALFVLQSRPCAVAEAKLIAQITSSKAATLRLQPHAVLVCQRAVATGCHGGVMHACEGASKMSACCSLSLPPQQKQQVCFYKMDGMPSGQVSFSTCNVNCEW